MEKRTESLMHVPDDRYPPPAFLPSKDADFTGFQCYTAGHVPVAQPDRAAVS